VVYFLCASPRLRTDGTGFINLDESSPNQLLSMASDACHLLIDSFIHDTYPMSVETDVGNLSCVGARCFPYLSFLVSPLHTDLQRVSFFR
jgi:hypothetical protein